jgi:hypothetical protein
VSLYQWFCNYFIAWFLSVVLPFFIGLLALFHLSSLCVQGRFFDFSYALGLECGLIFFFFFCQVTLSCWNLMNYFFGLI